MKLPKYYLRKLWRSCMEFDLIKEQDSIMVGLSGGKDSLFLLYALHVMKKYSPFHFKISASTIDLGYGKLPQDRLERYCQRLEVPYFFEKTEISRLVETESPSNPCNRCSFYRRGALIRVCKREKANVLALAHHKDDAIETFLLNLFHSGQLKTFQPNSFLDKSGLRLVRPLVYFTEAEVEGGLKYTGTAPIKDPCPYSESTQRKRVKDLLKELSLENPLIYRNLAGVIREGKEICLWPEPKEKEHLKPIYRKYLGNIDKDDI